MTREAELEDEETSSFLLSQFYYYSPDDDDDGVMTCLPDALGSGVLTAGEKVVFLCCFFVVVWNDLPHSHPGDLSSSPCWRHHPLDKESAAAAAGFWDHHHEESSHPELVRRLLLLRRMTRKIARRTNKIVSAEAPSPRVVRPRRHQRVRHPSS